MGPVSLIDLLLIIPSTHFNVNHVIQVETQVLSTLNPTQVLRPKKRRRIVLNSDVFTGCPTAYLPSQSSPASNQNVLLLTKLVQNVET